MLFLILGLVLLVTKIAEVGPFADLGWGWVLAPFGLAVAWWAFSDSFGITQRRAINKMDERKKQRRERDIKALGLDVRRERRIRVLRDSSRKPPAAGSPPPPPREPRT